MADLPRPDIPLRDQIVEAQLHALGLRDFVDRFEGSRKRPAHEVERNRERATVADAIVSTLRGVAAGPGEAA